MKLYPLAPRHDIAPVIEAGARHVFEFVPQRPCRFARVVTSGCFAREMIVGVTNVPLAQSNENSWEAIYGARVPLKVGERIEITVEGTGDQAIATLLAWIDDDR